MQSRSHFREVGPFLVLFIAAMPLLVRPPELSDVTAVSAKDLPAIWLLAGTGSYQPLHQSLLLITIAVG